MKSVKMPRRKDARRFRKDANRTLKRNVRLHRGGTRL